MTNDAPPFRLSAWTALPALQLIDAGTPQVESFTSYLGRLQDAMGVKRSFLCMMIDGSLDRLEISGIVRSALIGPGLISRKRASSLGALTGQDLLGSTLAPFADVIQTRGAGLRLDSQRRWCPTCLMEGEGNTGLIERLIWNFSAYSHCSLHSTPIIDSCRECGSPQRLRAKRVFRCPTCKAPLHYPGILESCSHLQKWTNSKIEAITSWCSTNGGASLDPSNYQIFVQNLIDDGTLEALRDTHPRFWTDTIRFRRRKPTFTTLINFSAIKSIDPISILTDPIPASSSTLFSNEEVKGYMAVDLRDYALALKKVDIVLKALLGSGTRMLPSNYFIAKLVVEDVSFPVKSCPTYERFNVLRSDRTFNLLGSIKAARCIQLGLGALASGANKANAIAVVRGKALASKVIAENAVLTATAIRKAMSSKAYASIQ